MLEIDEELATAEVQGVTKDGFYRIKVSFPDAGLYITGIRARESNYGGDVVWAQLPSYTVAGKRIFPFEWSNGPFKSMVSRLATCAVKQYENAKLGPIHHAEPAEEPYEPTPEDLQFLNDSDA